MESKAKAIRPKVINVKLVTVNAQGRTERELKGKELEDWKKQHGFSEDENK